MLSLVPFIIAAGFLESYVTHNYQDLPEWSKWVLILFSFGLILFVYVFYPLYVARKYPHLVDQEESAPFFKRSDFEFFKIRSVGTVIADSFQFYRLHFHKFARVIATLALPLIIVLAYFQDINRMEDMQTEHWYDWMMQLNILIGYDFHSLQDILVAICWTFIFTIIYTAVYWSMKSMHEQFSWRSYFNFAKSRFLPVWIGNLLLFAIVFLLPWYLLIWAILLIPLFYLQGATMGLDNAPFGKRFKKSFAISKNHYGKSLLVILILIVLTILLVQPVAFVFSIHEGFNDKPLVKDLLDMFAELVKRIAREFTDNYMVVGNIVRQIVYVLFLLGIVPLVVISTGFSYFSEIEKTEAIGLRKSFDKFGKRNRFQEKPVDFE